MPLRRPSDCVLLDAILLTVALVGLALTLALVGG